MEKPNDLWKPDKSTKNALRRSKRKAKRKQKKADKLKARDALIAQFGLNEYATNIAICFCIFKETGKPMPGKDSGVTKYMLDYWRQSQNPVKKRPRKRLSSEKFYSSKKWRELRYIALSNSDGKCNLCGATAHDGVTLHVDHIKPRSKYPDLEHDLDNLQVICSDCNLGKSNYDDRDWRLLME